VTRGEYHISVTKGQFQNASFDGVTYQSDRITVHRTPNGNDSVELFVTVRRFL
jgi:hypothetical protein